MFNSQKQILRCALNDNFLFFYFFKPFNKYSNPFSLISYMVANKCPNLPGGKPLLWNQTKYVSGKLESTQPLYLPKGIFMVTNSVNIFGSIIHFCHSDEERIYQRADKREVLRQAQDDNNGIKYFLEPNTLNSKPTHSQLTTHQVSQSPTHQVPQSPTHNSQPFKVTSLY